VGTAGMLTSEFVDIDRIEILRGPQGTTFGRDSTGGAIRIWTKKPTDEYSADVTATVGTYNRRDVKLSVNLPITDKLLTKWTGASLSRDGYVKSLTTGKGGGGNDQTVFNGDILWTPISNLSWRIKYQQGRNFFTEPRIQDAVFKGTYPQAGQAVGVPDLYEAAGHQAFDAQTQTAGYPGGLVGEWQNRSEINLPDHVFQSQASSDITWTVSDALQLEFLTAQTSQDTSAITDWDNSQYQLVEDVNQGKLDVFSQEVQLSGKKGRINWVGGAYYWNDTRHARSTRYQVEEFVSGLYDINAAFANPICTAVEHPHPAPKGSTYLSDCQDVYAAAAGPGGRFDSITRSTTDGWAAYGEVTINLTDSIDLTVGLRHHKQNSFQQPLAAIPGVTAPRAESANEDFVGDIFAGSAAGILGTPSSFAKNTKKLSLQKQFNPDVMAYLSYSEGFDSGGASVYVFPTGERLISAYKPQTLENTEVGFRSDLADNKLRLNFTVFHTIWKDIQSSGVVLDDQGHQVPQLLTTNVGEALAQGAELEMTIVPTDHLLFNINVGTLDAKYTKIAPGTPFLTLNTAFEDAPKRTGSLGVQYDAMLNGGSSLSARVDYLYQSQFWRSLPFLRTSFWNAVPAGFDESGGSGILNARVTYTPSDAKWDLAVFGTNLTNERLINSGFFHGIWGFDFATVGRPREGGVAIDFKF
ncbi:MAG TPA: TonB-dependent receptor, partial [Gammaproteobacteria bacterium]|nr:TonB-dependent receptor [Gammaproteobacteria bacterium]